jgi:hypothetical protein
MDLKDQICAPAKAVEEALLQKLADEARETCDGLVLREKQNAAAKQAMGGRHTLTCIDIRMDGIKSIVDGVAAARKRLTANAPVLASGAEIDALKIRLEQRY